MVYTEDKPELSPGCLLTPFKSPIQNYSELWAHKKIWEGHIADAVGIFHYRRYLDLSKPVLEFPLSSKRPIPYKIHQKPDINVYSKEKLELLMRNFDVIAPTAEWTGIPVYERFGQYSVHRKEDLKLVCDILLDLYPEFSDAAKQYLSGKIEYYGNLFLMRWKFFDQYCQILFKVLEHFEEQAQEPPPRTPGYLGERIFGIYFTWLQTQPNVHCGEVPRVHFWGYDDATHHFRRNMIINQMLPPGSVRRYWAKRLIKGRLAGLNY